MFNEKGDLMDSKKDSPAGKRGYLSGDFELFHIKDNKNLQFEFHYHDFIKIIIFISGRVKYLIEGKSYRLKPWDVLLVTNKEIHKPLIEPGSLYERIIIWINPAFLLKHSSGDCNLLSCFELAFTNNYNLLRINPELLRNLRHILLQLENACSSKDFGSRILKNSLLMQFIVHLNRLFLGTVKNIEPDNFEYDETIGNVLKYINRHLSEDLSIDYLSSRFYISRYYLMHRFKQQTGYTIYNYILQKRLIMASTLLSNGKPVNEVSVECGFGDYSSFVRSFKKMFGLAPRNYCKRLAKMQELYNQSNHFAYNSSME
jgi:AraC-like DNA-binding protein